MKLTSVAVVAVATVGLPLISAGQTPQSIRRVVGHSVAEQLQFDARMNSTTDTLTLAFKTSGDAPALTVDFVARYATARPARPPIVVDMIVTERPLEDDDPQMTMRVDGEPFPLIGWRAQPPVRGRHDGLRRFRPADQSRAHRRAGVQYRIGIRPGADPDVASHCGEVVWTVIVTCRR